MKFVMTSSPHIRGKCHTSQIMVDVLIALIPAAVMSVVYFGVRAAVLELVCIASAVLGEWWWLKATKKSDMVKNGSAAVTGLLFAFTLPVSVPYWVAVVGSFFAVIVVKGMCGGLGQNVFNPALSARAFVLLIWPVYITRFPEAGTQSVLQASIDAASAATPLHEMQMKTLPDASLLDMFFGNVGGCIGEVSAFALLIGGVYLLVRKIINYRIPVAFLGSVAVLTFLFNNGNDPFLWMLYSLLGGGVILGAIFMATDYATSPVTPKGQVLYGICAGALTVFFRYTGLFPEGVTYAILLMNGVSWLIDRHTPPRRFGTKKGAVG